MRVKRRSDLFTFWIKWRHFSSRVRMKSNPPRIFFSYFFRFEVPLIDKGQNTFNFCPTKEFQPMNRIPPIICPWCRSEFPENGPVPAAPICHGCYAVLGNLPAEMLAEMLGSIVGDRPGARRVL